VHPTSDNIANEKAALQNIVNELEDKLRLITSEYSSYKSSTEEVKHHNKVLKSTTETLNSEIDVLNTKVKNLQKLCEDSSSVTENLEKECQDLKSQLSDKEDLSVVLHEKSQQFEVYIAMSRDLMPKIGAKRFFSQVL
jgi:chromosome segregation ATPase